MTLIIIFYNQSEIDTEDKAIVHKFYQKVYLYKKSFMLFIKFG